MSWKYIYLASGGAHSTCMILKAAEEGLQIDGLLFYDHGFHRDEVYVVIERLKEDFGGKVVTLYPRGPDGDRKELDYYLAEIPVKRRDTGEVVEGRGWPSPRYSWCCQLGISAMRRYEKRFGSVVERAGICYLEKVGDPRYGNTRWRKVEYPLKWYRITRRLAVEFCRERGYNWSGLYDRVDRCRCWCCPLERTDELMLMWLKNRDRWEELEGLDERIRTPFRAGGVSVKELGERFAAEWVGKIGSDGVNFLVESEELSG